MTWEEHIDRLNEKIDALIDERMRGEIDLFGDETDATDAEIAEFTLERAQVWLSWKVDLIKAFKRWVEEQDWS